MEYIAIEVVEFWTDFQMIKYFSVWRGEALHGGMTGSTGRLGRHYGGAFGGALPWRM